MYRKILFSSIISVSSLLLLHNPVQAREMDQANGKLAHLTSGDYVCVNNPSSRCGTRMPSGMGGEFQDLRTGKLHHLAESHLCLNSPSPECGNPVHPETVENNRLDRLDAL